MKAYIYIPFFYAFFFELIASQCISASGAICWLTLAERDLGVLQQRTPHCGRGLMSFSAPPAETGPPQVWHQLEECFGILSLDSCLHNINKIHKNKSNSVQRARSRFIANATGSGFSKRSSRNQHNQCNSPYFWQVRLCFLCSWEISSNGKSAEADGIAILVWRWLWWSGSSPSWDFSLQIQTDTATGSLDLLRLCCEH